jgi:hypothetical protein
MPVSLHRLTRAFMGSFTAMFVAPSRNREYPNMFLHYGEVVTCTHKRSKPCGTSELHARPHFLFMGHNRWSKPITILVCKPTYPPFSKSALSLSIGRPIQTQSSHYTIDSPIQATLTIHHRSTSASVLSLSIGRSIRTFFLSLHYR